jgi:murein DD-endopeptidase MepM/ murein hydrolase activator NlpD
LPVARENISWANGFGANSYAEKYGNPDSEFYNPENPKYAKSAGIHPGLDFDADAGSVVNSNVYGKVLINANPYPTDAAPNVVILVVPNQNGECGICVVFSHVDIYGGLLDGQQVRPGQQIGTVADQGTGSHVHLSLREGTQVVHNPINYFTDPIILEGLPWSGYAEGENLYSISSYKLPPGNALYNFWTDGEAAAGVIRP